MKSKTTIIFFSILVLLYSCRRKTVPTTTTTSTAESTNVNIAKTDSALVRKPVVKAKPKPKEAPPKVIAVNDAVAKKSVDGRLYYDLLGQRYWKNYKDGKYYLFNKSMYSNPAFKAPK
jgi:hypothetical protein